MSSAAAVLHPSSPRPGSATPSVAATPAAAAAASAPVRRPDSQRTGGLSFILAEAQRLGLRPNAPPASPSASSAAATAAADPFANVIGRGATDEKGGGGGDGGSGGEDAAAAAAADARDAADADPDAAWSLTRQSYASARTVALWRAVKALRRRGDALALQSHSLSEYHKVLSVCDTRVLTAKLSQLQELARHSECIANKHNAAAFIKRLVAKHTPNDTLVLHQNVQQYNQLHARHCTALH
jgi:hypothetical protein